MDRIVAFIFPFPWASADDKQRIPLIEQDSPNIVKFMGSSVISVDVSTDSNTKVYLGSTQDTLPKLGLIYSPPNSSKKFQLYELPQPFLRSSDKNIRITTVKNGEQLKCSIIFQGSIKPPPKHEIRSYFNKSSADNDKTSNNSNESEENLSLLLLKLISSWVDIINEIIASNFYDESKQARNSYRDTEYIKWKNIVSLLLEEKKRKDEPRMALIVKIAEKMQEILEKISRNPRRRLMRDNQLQNIQKIQEIDSNSLRWIARQPGKTIPEKGGTKQKIMAVVRVSSFDTLENRIFKDFLKRSIEASFKYIREYNHFENSKSTRFRNVKKFNILSQKIINAPFLNDVQKIESVIQPNYVLQSGEHYKDLWKWYQRLVKQDYEIDNAWAWQSRLWSNIAALLVSIVLSGGSAEEDNGQKKNNHIEIKPIANSEARFRSEQIFGSWLFSESIPGPCWFEYDNKIYVIEAINSSPSHAEKHPICKYLGGTGGHLYILITDTQTQKKVVIVFWGIHGASTTTLPSMKEIADSAASSLFNIYQDLYYNYSAPKLAGCVMVSSMKEEIKDDEAFNQEKPMTKVYAIQFPSTPDKWHDIIEKLQIFFVVTLDLINQEK
ncbi:MAG: DUF2357 domain-containing protein [Desulfamplus sp.]|nr:DUF2357 domain-containing protein [Desulfamplus sp.]